MNVEEALIKLRAERDELVRVANDNRQRAEHAGVPQLQYAISKREIIDYGMEEI